MADNSLTRPPTEEELREIMREHNLQRQYDADSVFNDLEAARSYEGMGDPYQHYLDSLEGRQNFQRERQPLDPKTLEHLQRYRDLQREHHRKTFKPPTSMG